MRYTFESTLTDTSLEIFDDVYELVDALHEHFSRPLVNDQFTLINIFRIYEGEYKDVYEKAYRMTEVWPILEERSEGKSSFEIEVRKDKTGIFENWETNDYGFPVFSTNDSEEFLKILSRIAVVEKLKKEFKHIIPTIRLDEDEWSEIEWEDEIIGKCTERITTNFLLSNDIPLDHVYRYLQFKLNTVPLDQIEEWRKM